MDLSNGGDGYVVRVRGLPWSSTRDDIVAFFAPLEIRNGPHGVRFTFTPEGRPSGEAFVEFMSCEACDVAVKKNNEHMGRRYIEVFKSKKSEMDWVLQRVGPADGSGGHSIHGMGTPGSGTPKAYETVVKLRGLPYDCGKEDVEQFFAGLQIVPNGILFTLEAEGRRTGEAYVEFISPEEAEKAQKKHRHMMAHRYIEVFKSSQNEMKRSGRLETDGRQHYAGRPVPYERPRGDYDGGHNRYGSGYERRYRGGGRSFERDEGSSAGGYGGQYDYYYEGYGHGFGMRRDNGMGGQDAGVGGMAAMAPSSPHRVRMRGLPFTAAEQDIMGFFSPLNPVTVHMEYDRQGRASGEATVYFSTHEEAGEAMGKNRQMMGHRYIELFLHSTPTCTPMAQVNVSASLPGMTPQSSRVLQGSPAIPDHGVMAVSTYGIAAPGVPATEQQLLTTAYPATSMTGTTIGGPVSVSGAPPLLASTMGPVISMAPTVPLTVNPQINAASMAAAAAAVVASVPRDTQPNFTF